MNGDDKKPPAPATQEEGPPKNLDVDEEDKTGDLTSAEREVALLALAGKSNNEIAEARHCSVRTVANQLQSVFRKLGIRSRAELAAKASLL
jgi:DNA-binding CsgD family transcriptional regulator